MELEPAPLTFRPILDRRRHIPPPPPVRLLAVDDVSLPAAAGLERQLDAFYVGLFGFERQAESEWPVYRSENFSVRFDVVEPPVQREEYRAVGVEVPSLPDLEEKLIESRTEYARQRGLLPGTERIVLLDPAGNWLEIVDRRGVR